VFQKASVTSASSAPVPLKRERRASVRRDSNAKGTCQTLSQRHESTWEATVRNISLTGIGLLLARRFEPGTLLAIELTETSEQRQRLLVARVAHATLQPDDKWLIGCAFMSPLHDEELQELL
jgi:hypothetical protein